MFEGHLSRKIAAVSATVAMGLTPAACDIGGRKPADQSNQTTSAPNHVKPLAIDRIVFHHVTIPGSKPFIEIDPTQTTESIRKAWALFRKTAEEVIPTVPSIESGGEHTFGTEIGNVTDLCNDDKKAQLHDALGREALAVSEVGHKGTDLTIIILNVPEMNCYDERGYSTGEPPAADADGYGRTIISYGKSSNVAPTTIAHELDHAVTGYKHDNGMWCDPQNPNIIYVNAACLKDKHGFYYNQANPTTFMGFGMDDENQDPKSGFALQRLGIINGNEIKTLDTTGEFDVDFHALIDPQEGTKLVRIPLTGADFDFHLASHTTALYLELSGNTDYKPQQDINLMAYFVNERGLTDPKEPYNDTYILPLTGDQFNPGLLPKDIGRTITIQIGKKQVNITLTEITPGSQPATGSAKAKITITEVARVTPSPTK
jgi:hypothetical protein